MIRLTSTNNMTKVKINILETNYSENLRGTILSDDSLTNTLSKSEKIKISQLLNIKINKSKSIEDKKIFHDILDSLNLRISKEINDARDEIFMLNSQELNWLRRYPDDKWVEYLVYRYKFRLFPKRKILTNFPPYLLIEPTSVCNLRCIMCFQVDTSFTKKKYMGMMPWDIFTKAVDEASEKGCKAITLASRGEPTLHPKLPKMIKYISDKGILDLKINTNATKLNDKLSYAILENNVSELVFSVDAGTKETYEQIRVLGKFDKVLNNIKNFNKIRSNYFKKSACITRISGVKVKKEQNIDQMVSFWEKYVDEVSIKPATPRWDSYNNKPIKITKSCNQLWERMYVWYDGKINPCDFDYKSFLSVGNIKNNSLEEIWNSNEYNSLRKKHIEKKRSDCFPCDRCPL